MVPLHSLRVNESRPHQRSNEYAGKAKSFEEASDRTGWFADGLGEHARFRCPMGVVQASDGTIYITVRVRKQELSQHATENTMDVRMQGTRTSHSLPNVRARVGLMGEIISVHFERMNILVHVYSRRIGATIAYASEHLAEYGRRWRASRERRAFKTARGQWHVSTMWRALRSVHLSASRPGLD